MPKRDIDSEIWDKCWFRVLPPHVKSFWFYLCSKADAVGVWNGDWELASFYIGSTVDESILQEYPDLFGGRIEKIGRNKYWLNTFVDFQYPKLFNRKESELKNNLMRLMEKHGILEKWMEKNNIPMVGSKIAPILNNKQQTEKETEITNKTRLGKFIAEKLVQVTKMKTQLTTHDCITLEAEYDFKALTDTLFAMDNKVDLCKKYVSVNLTLRKWLGMNKDFQKKVVQWKTCDYCHDKFPENHTHFLGTNCSQHPSFRTGTNADLDSIVNELSTKTKLEKIQKEKGQSL